MNRGLLTLLLLGTACATPVAHRESQSHTAAAESSGYVARSGFTTAIENREPVDRVNVLHDYESKIYYFTDLRDMTGDTIIHRWMLDGEVVANVPFQVRGPRWRVYSSKRLEPHMLGRWSVVVLDGSGNTVATSTFAYVQGRKTRMSGGSVPASPDPDETLFERGARGTKSFFGRMFGDDD